MNVLDAACWSIFGALVKDGMVGDSGIRIFLFLGIPGNPGIDKINPVIRDSEITCELGACSFFTNAGRIRYKFYNIPRHSLLCI